MVQVSVGWAPCFAVFACLLALAYWFVDRCVPETRGLTLEQIQLKLSSRTPNDNTRYDDLSQDDDDDDDSPSETTRLISR
mmetsp:Transcript_22651/g.55979  ORF Transcript_22651/g.55979 Transcript_22651/m.55979 type:complete len:80 (+) Transcript_22651:85-324(+)